jgi:hypothetical protein
MRLLTGPWLALRRALHLSGPRLYDLDVVDQWLVLTMARFGECTFRRLEAELLAIRGATPAEVVSSILKLEQAGVLGRSAVAGLLAEERRFRLTVAGARLGRLLPAEPRSPTLFYV